ncbi:hypothetical protein ABKA04_005431 [Annulohypoxylon sp. FPYF3050]
MYRDIYPPTRPPPDYGNERYDRPTQPSYPPPAEPSSRQWNDRRDEYQFRGPYSDLRRTHPDDRRRSDIDYRDRDRDRDYDRDRDNYRPPQGDFTFRMEPPPGVDPYDTYRPRDREWDQYGSRTDNRDNHDDERNASYQSRRVDNDRQAGRNGRSRRPDDRRRQHNLNQPQRGIGYARRGNYRDRPKASARLLLHKKHDDNPELMLGDTGGRATYRDIDELSNSDEEEMEISDNSDADVAEPANKRARTSATATAAEQEAPRWSNPDPYTALPPPDESSRKKKDMVQLIRKARVEAEAKKPAAQIEGLDFISCDINDNDDNHDDKTYSSISGGGNETQQTQQTRQELNTTSNTKPSIPTATSQTVTATANLPPKPSTGSSQPDLRTSIPHAPSHGDKSYPIDLTSSPALGNRKRTINDTIKSYPSSSKPGSSSKSANRMDKAGYILPEWQHKGDPCPWFKPENLTSFDTPASRLYKEIVDFYRWVSPRDFESDCRQELVTRLTKFVQRKWPDVELYPFGSYMSGMYLPIGDMDIAVCSKSYTSDSIPKYNKRRDLYALSAYIRSRGMAKDDNIEVISRARVPLVKFVDSKSHLKVDFSFEKNDGRRAIQTLLDWQKTYPAMPVIVAVMKQFLMMRGLNEPVSGGIGGLSVTCMVMNLLNQLPQVQSTDMAPEQFLGEILMEFLNYYGHHFQYRDVAIRMNPPELFPKYQDPDLYGNYNRLSIIDPNNPDNDIAGGSYNIETILKSFRDAYNAIKARMSEVVNRESLGDDPFGDSLLGPLIGGNYACFEAQREHLRGLSKTPKSATKPYNHWGKW